MYFFIISSKLRPIRTFLPVVCMSDIGHTEREAVLDQYFKDITVEKVKSEKEAWNRINDKPQLWSK